jgi:putative sterol carrier protein
MIERKSTMDASKIPVGLTVGSRKFALMKDLRVDGDSSPESTLKKLGELLGSMNVHAILQLRIIGGKANQSVHQIRVGDPTDDSGEDPTVEVITTLEDWTEMASAHLSPIEAFLRGKIRVRGDVTRAQDIFKLVAGSEGRTHLCVGKRL